MMRRLLGVLEGIVATVLAVILVSLTIVTGRRPASNNTIEVLEQTPSFYGQLHVIRKLLPIVLPYTIYKKT